MTIQDLDWWVILDVLILLLIGMGPKIALVPFVEMTADLSSEVRKGVASKMVKTATLWAIILVLLGALLKQLFHFSEESLYIAGGIVFFLLALNMLVSGSKEHNDHGTVTEKEAEKMALYPLAVPYLLNPVGITMFIIFSATMESIGMHLLLIIFILIIALFDWFIFTHLDRFIKHLDKSKLAVTEAIFGVILAALAIELVLRGISELGLIENVSY